ncbi:MULTISPECIES: GntR family transcriptional regulator [unclassified Pseudarthrobacter]|uniref:GntR family transcriptional regulator n=1 Tax=unclassified Pseudarthrobacter TaxID=2647000 RepID=UPI0036375244
MTTEMSSAAPAPPGAAESFTGTPADCYSRLKAELIDHSINRGTVLLETALAKRYGVSRTPVREALTRLEQDGLLERVPRGFRVRDSSSEDIMELYEARIALESAAAASAALRRTDLDLARLAHLGEVLAQQENVQGFSAASASWHQALWASAHNKTLAALLDRVITQMRLFDDAPVGNAWSLEHTVEEHELILEAIRDHDQDGASEALATHLGRTRDLRLAALAQQPIR